MPVIYTLACGNSTPRRPTVTPRHYRRTCGCQHLGEATKNLVEILIFQRNVERLHALGPRATGELLAEIGEQRHCRTFIEQRLAAYAALDPEIVRALKGDQFPRPPLHKAPS
jgi:hypothetical protein